MIPLPAGCHLEGEGEQRIVGDPHRPCVGSRNNREDGGTATHCQEGKSKTRPRTPPTHGVAHDGQLLVPVCVDGDQVPRLSIESIPPDGGARELTLNGIYTQTMPHHAGTESTATI